MTDPQKPISENKAEELEEKEAPRRGSIFSGGEGEVFELEEKEAPRRASLVGTEGGEVGAEAEAGKVLELEEKEAPRRASFVRLEGTEDIEIEGDLDRGLELEE